MKINRKTINEMVVRNIKARPIMARRLMAVAKDNNTSPFKVVSWFEDMLKDYIESEMVENGRVAISGLCSFYRSKKTGAVISRTSKVLNECMKPYAIDKVPAVGVPTKMTKKKNDYGFRKINASTFRSMFGVWMDTVLYQCTGCHDATSLTGFISFEAKHSPAARRYNVGSRKYEQVAESYRVSVTLSRTFKKRICSKHYALHGTI